MAAWNRPLLPFLHPRTSSLAVSWLEQVCQGALWAGESLAQRAWQGAGCHRSFGERRRQPSASPHEACCTPGPQRAGVQLHGGQRDHCPRNSNLSAQESWEERPCRCAWLPDREPWPGHPQPTGAETAEPRPPEEPPGPGLSAAVSCQRRTVMHPGDPHPA